MKILLLVFLITPAFADEPTHTVIYNGIQYERGYLTGKMKPKLNHLNQPMDRDSKPVRTDWYGKEIEVEDDLSMGVHYGNCVRYHFSNCRGLVC